ncbi:MAG: NUDIX hydrolase, partial [Candidatus Promineifilaceae bacterium]
MNPSTAANKRALNNEQSTTQPSLEQYAHPFVTVDIVIFSLALQHGDLRVLLIERDRQPFNGIASLPGGFVHVGESLEASAERQLSTKTGLSAVYMEQLFTFGRPERDPRNHVITVAYFALVPFDMISLSKMGASLKLASVFNLPELAFDHAEIVRSALQRLRYKLEYTSLGFELLPDKFTLTELQRAYEIVLSEKLDKRNFRRKILSAEIIEPTGDTSRGGEGRPAKL